MIKLKIDKKTKVCKHTRTKCIQINFHKTNSIGIKLMLRTFTISIQSTKISTITSQIQLRIKSNQ